MRQKLLMGVTYDMLCRLSEYNLSTPETYGILVQHSAATYMMFSRPASKLAMACRGIAKTPDY